VNGLLERADPPRLFIDGKPVYESPYAAERTDEPQRKHLKKRWHRGRNYHQRIQKKWIVRFGWIHEPRVYMSKGAIFAHPSLIPAIRKSLNNG